MLRAYEHVSAGGETTVCGLLVGYMYFGEEKKKDELSLFKWFNIYSEGMILMLLVSNLIHLCFAECILMLHYGSSTEGAYPITPF